MSVQNSQEISDVKVMLVKGIDGEGVESIEKTGTSGLVDTYTITYTDGAKTTFTVTNGKGIASITKTSTTGTVDTYTITYNDGTTSTFEVTNGTVASAIAYDNTTSGLTGDTVQEAVDELADSYPADKVLYGSGTVKDALDDIHKNNLSAVPVNIISYSSTFYETPSDGYLYITAKHTTSAAALVRANIFGNNEAMNMLATAFAPASGSQAHASIFLRAGMKVKIDVNVNPDSGNKAQFIPLV